MAPGGTSARTEQGLPLLRQGAGRGCGGCGQSAEGAVGTAGREGTGRAQAGCRQGAGRVQEGCRQGVGKVRAGCEQGEAGAQAGCGQGAGRVRGEGVAQARCRQSTLPALPAPGSTIPPVLPSEGSGSPGPPARGHCGQSWAGEGRAGARGSPTRAGQGRHRSPPLIRYSRNTGRRKFPASVVRKEQMPGNSSSKPVEPVMKLQKAPTQRMP